MREGIWQGWFVGVRWVGRFPEGDASSRWLIDIRKDVFRADDYDRGGDPRAPASDESDPLAELARLIGQTDPFGSMGRANQQVPPRTSAPAINISLLSISSLLLSTEPRPQYQPPRCQHPRRA